MTVDLAFTGTATNVTDYTRSSAQIVITAGNTTGTVTLTAVQDTLDEANETVLVDITNVTNGTESGTQQVTATITDDDAGPSVTLSVNPASLAEAAGTSTVTATLSAVSTFDVTVDLAFTGTATNVTDYTRSAAQIVITAGNTTGTITLTAVQDTLDEANETILVDISAVTNGTESGTQQVTATITDDDAPPTVTLSVAPASFAEAAGTSTVTATLSAASTLDVTVVLAFTGTATNVTDYTRSGTQIVITAGNTTGTVTLTAVQDVLDESNETVVVDISNVTNGTESGTQQVTATITDDDAAPTVTLSITPATIVEAAGTSTITATLSAVSGLDVTVDLAFTGTATNVTDYTRSSGQIVITAGNTTGTLTLTAVQDTLDEVDETIVADINTVTNGTESGTQQVTATITDDDAPPTVTLTVDKTTILETGGVATVTATLSAISGKDVTVNLTFGGTATGGGVDYTQSQSQIVIPAGQPSGTITLTSKADAVDDTNETISVALGTVTNGTAGTPAQVLVTVNEDPGTASIRGFAWIDINGNGVKETTEAALPGVTVRLTGRDLQNRVVEITTMTDSVGAYRFENLPGGTYDIIETQPKAFSDGAESLGKVNGVASGTAGSDRFTAVVLAPTQQGVDYNFGEGSLKSDYISRRLFLASRTTETTNIRNLVALGEEREGDVNQAAAIRQGEAFQIRRIDKQVDVLGTSAADTVQFIPANSTSATDSTRHTVVANGIRHTFPAADVNVIVINGAGDNDTIEMRDSRGNDALRTNRDKAILAIPDVRAEAIAFELVKAISSSGGDDTHDKEEDAVDYVLELAGPWREI